MRMNTDLQHLPARKRRELDRIKDILFAEFADAIALGNSEWRKNGRILSIILFGSYARGDWVDEPYTKKGYKSDYDLLVIVSHKKLTDFTKYWYEATETLMRDKSIRTPVSFIVHSLDEVNSALSEGRYFFCDIQKQGVVLHEKPNVKLATPKPLNAEDAYEMAKEHSEFSLDNAKASLDGSRFHFGEGNFNKAAFELHQATEATYAAVLLALTNYIPKTHDLRKLRALAEDLDKRLVAAWPRDNRAARANFNKLRDAYVKARYSKHYTISTEALNWLGERTKHLHTLAETVCAECLFELEKQAKVGE